MIKGNLVNHIIQTVLASQGSDKEIINSVYDAVKTHSTRSTKSALRVKVLSGDYFGKNIVFFLELLDQCGLEVTEKKESS